MVTRTKTPEPTREMWLLAQDGCDETRREIATHYWGMVKAIGVRVAREVHYLEDTDDIISYGAIGLLDAIGKFDVDRGVKFRTYAARRIRGAIIDEMRSNDWVPRSVRSKARKIRQAQKDLEIGETELYESTNLIAEYTHMDPDEVDQTISEIEQARMASLDIVVTDDQQETITLGNVLPDPTICPEESYREREIQQSIASAMSGMGEDEQTVLALYYVQDLHFEEIGNMIGVTASRVCQMHAKAMHSLHTQLVGA